MGQSGLKVSALSFGSWVTFGDQIDRAVARALLIAAYEAGINYFDNADVYANGESEAVMGEIVRELPREALVLSSKVYWQTMPGPNGRGLSRKHIMESCHASLRRMQVEYLDLYFCHRFDEETPLEEVVRAMEDLIRQGKVLYWGTSEWSADQLRQAYLNAKAVHGYPPAVEQPQYNMFVRHRLEHELAPAADELGFGMVTWSPLKYGLLSGKYNQGMPTEETRLTREPEWGEKVLSPDRLEAVRQLTEIAAENDASMAQLAIAWLLRLPQVSSVITGATKPAHLADNLGAIDVVKRLTPQVLERIEGVLESVDDQP
jgi:voltage-dependent potassium channel beta subunit